METLSINVRYRPLRIGWCVRKDDLAGLRESWQLSATMWGGRYNPIIPVDNPGYACALVELFHVDCLWPISNDKTVKSFIDTFPHLPNPFYGDQLFAPHGNSTRSATILDIYHPVLSLYEEHFKNNPNPEFKVALYEWAEEDPLFDIWLATFGAVPSEQITGTDYVGVIEEYLATERVPIGLADPWPVNRNNLCTLFGLGRSGMQRHYSVTNHWNYPGFYLGSCTDFDDLVNYWNLRATDTHILFFDVNHTDRFDGIRREWLKLLRSRPKGHFESGSAIAIWSKNRDKQRDLKIFGKGLLDCTVGRETWNGLNVKAPYMYFSEGSSLANVGTSFGKQRVSFQLPSKPFSENHLLRSEHLIISLDMKIGLFGNERSTLTTPYIPELNEFYGRKYYFEWNKARVEPDGLGIISRASRSDLTVDPIDVTLLIEQIFRVAGIIATPSKPGLIASRLIQQMGGLQKCRPFKIQGVRDLIENFGPDKSFTRSNAIQTIRAKNQSTGEIGFSLYEDLFIEQRAASSKLTPDAVLSYLMKKSVFRAGLEFDCPNCRLEFWAALDNLRTDITCAFCGHQFNITPHLNHRGDWRFRRSGLFGGDDNQEGAIPVMLTLQQLDTTFSPRMLYTTAMNLKPDSAKITECETDFVIMAPNHRDERVQIAIGECKTRKCITADDITKLKAVAAAFPSERFEVFVILTKLTAFTSDEVKHAAALNDKYNNRAILLTARELEPYFLYDRTSKEFIINRIAVSFEDMAIITHQIYFQVNVSALPI